MSLFHFVFSVVAYPHLRCVVNDRHDGMSFDYYQLSQLTLLRLVGHPYIPSPLVRVPYARHGLETVRSSFSFFAHRIFMRELNGRLLGLEAEFRTSTI